MAGSQRHDHAPMHQRVGAWQYDHAAVRLAGEYFYDTFKIRRVASANDGERHREPWHDGLDRTQHTHFGRRREIADPSDTCDARRDLRERFEPFSSHRIFEADKSSNVSSWTGSLQIPLRRDRGPARRQWVLFEFVFA